MAGIPITINSRHYDAPKSPMLGREIKALANAPIENMLVEVIHNPDPAAGGDDKIIADDQAVDLKNGMRFRIVNPATFG